MQNRYKQIHVQALCFWIYLLPAFIILASGVMTKKFFPWISQAILFFLGWLTWTFLEYIAHRFWMHNKPTQREKQALSNHLYHHTHPTELKVSNTDRFLLLLSGIVIIIAAIFLQNYFTLFAGFYLGFLSYTFMHVILHRKWAKILFPRLLQNHILHHCKFSNKCFGITVIWWDKLFDTAAPKNFQVSEKVISYYFGDSLEKKEKEIHEKLKTSLQLYNN